MNTTKTRTTVRNVPALRANIRTMRRDLHDVTALRETLSRAMLLTKKEADELAASLGPSFTIVNILGGTIVCSHYLRHEVLWMLRTASRSYSRIMEPIWREIHDAEEADSCFDHGEWSDEFHDKRRNREDERVSAMIAAKFGITAGDLYAATLRRANNDL